MKSPRWFVTAFFFVSVLFTTAQEKHNVGRTVLALEAKWNEAYKHGDIDALNVLLADDFIITVENGRTYSKPGYIAQLGGPTLHVDVSEMSDLNARVHGNLAIVTGAYHEKGTVKGNPYEYRDRMTDVWLNHEGQWQLVASHYAIPAK